MVILRHFGPSLTLFDPFWPFRWGAKAPSGSGPPKVEADPVAICLRGPLREAEIFSSSALVMKKFMKKMQNFF